MREVVLGSTFTFGFTTRINGVPTSLLGTPVLSVKEGANDTPITAGVSVDVDTCATPVTGLNEGTVVATSENGYESGKSYFCYISTGTVGGVSVVGEIVQEFTVIAAAHSTLVATDIVSAGAITTSGGKVSGVILTDTVTTYTGNTVQTGDSFARIGVAGAGLTALGDTRIANLDATVSSRLAASGYTTPPTSAAITTAVLAGVVEGATTVKESLMLSNAANAGKTDGFTPGSTGTGHLRNLADTKNRVTADYDVNGNRTAITTDLT